MQVIGDTLALNSVETTHESALVECCLCRSQMEPAGRQYSIDEIFEWWATRHAMSEGVIEEHRCQSAFTRLYCCPNCDLGFFFPQIVGSATFYGELQSNKAYFYQADKWEFGEALKDAICCDSIIEIGCGPGHFLSQASQKIPHVCGTEINAAAATSARERGLKVFDVVKPSQEEGETFDAAFSFHVLEHVADPVRFVRDMSALVKPCGRIGISVPNQNGPIKWIEPCFENMPPHHATRWSVVSLRKLASTLDLRIERIAYEPLLLSNHAYYSEYWIKYMFTSKSILHRTTGRILQRMLQKVFRRMLAKGAQYCRMLPGQSVYVLFSKQ